MYIFDKNITYCDFYFLSNLTKTRITNSEFFQITLMAPSTRKPSTFQDSIENSSSKNLSIILLILI